MKKRVVLIVQMCFFCTLVIGLIPLCAGSALAQNGRESLFKSKCAACHGPDGAAKTAMGTMLKIRDLHSEEVQKQNDTELTQIITKGKNKMPAFEAKLKKEEIAELVTYVRELGKKH